MVESPSEYSFDEILIGQKKEFSIKISESMVNDFAKLSGDYNPLHMDENYAHNTKFGRRVCHGMLLGSLFSQLVGMHLPGKKCLHLSQTLNFQNPCFIDDLVTVEGIVIGKSDARKILELETKILNQNNLLIIDGSALVLVLE